MSTTLPPLGRREALAEPDLQHSCCGGHRHAERESGPQTDGCQHGETHAHGEAHGGHQDGGCRCGHGGHDSPGG